MFRKMSIILILFSCFKLNSNYKVITIEEESLLNKNTRHKSEEITKRLEYKLESLKFEKKVIPELFEITANSIIDNDIKYDFEYLPQDVKDKIELLKFDRELTIIMMSYELTRFNFLNLIDPINGTNLDDVSNVSLDTLKNMILNFFSSSCKVHKIESIVDGNTYRYKVFYCNEESKQECKEIISDHFNLLYVLSKLKFILKNISEYKNVIDTKIIFLLKGLEVDLNEYKKTNETAELMSDTSVDLFNIRTLVNVNTVNYFGINPLMIASFKNDIFKVQKLIMKKANINGLDYYDRSSLHFAAISGSYEAAVLLLNNGAEIECTDCDVMTPLHLAVINNKYLVAYLLLKSGANVNALDEENTTPMQYANQKNDSQMIEILLKVKKDQILTL